MACSISLPLWPQALNCISWSKENLIAIAGGDEIAILTPRLTTPAPNATFWDASIIKVNEFNEKEVPLHNPLSFSNFSVGEELSSRHVHALEWSPLGLSRFGRCILAMLSTNHVLSLWECDGATHVDSNWKRKAMVNHALQAHYSRIHPEQQPSDRKQTEQTRVQQRIRAIAWAPASHTQDTQSYVTSRHQFLAVSTEGCEILLIRVRSPYDILASKTDQYDVEVVQSFRLDSSHSIDTGSGFANGESGKFPSGPNDDIAEYLAWTDWTHTVSGEIYAQLAYVSNGRLFSRKVVLDHAGPEPQITISRDEASRLLSDSVRHMRGPLKFAPGTGLLIAFASDKVICVDTAAATIGGEITSHHLDDRWDEISGLAFTQPSNELPSVHMVSHLSSATVPTTVLPLPLSVDAVPTRPPWQRAINESRDAFSAESSLAGNVADRVCGIANSPLGDYIITAATMEPSDCVTYLIMSGQRASLNITNEVPLSQGWISDPSLPSDVATETMLFSLQQHVALDESELEIDLALQEVMRPAATTSGESELGVESFRSPGSDLSGLIQHLRERIYSEPEIQTEKAKFLFDFVYKSTSTYQPILKVVLRHLADAILDLPIDLATRGIISSRIRANFALIKSKLQPGRSVDAAENVPDSVEEECRICHKSVPFESLKWARCETGHQFSRCSLTLIAIQEPGISKHCVVCGMQCLNEWIMPELAQSDDGDVGMTEIPGTFDQRNGSISVEREPTLSMARILFAALDSCIFCGGKFFA